MGALTANVVHKTQPRAGRDSYVIKNAVTLYAGALVGTDANGFLDKWADTTGLKFAGVVLANATGNTSASPKTEARVNSEGLYLRNVTLASVAQSDVNSLVYCTSDNIADITLSAATNVKAIGWIVRYVGTNTCDIQLFTPAEHLALN